MDWGEKMGSVHRVASSGLSQDLQNLFSYDYSIMHPSAFKLNLQV